MKIRNNEPRLICLPNDVRLVPGVNEIDDATWAALTAEQTLKNGSKTSYVADLLKGKAQGNPSLPVIEVVSEGAPLIPKDVLESLKDLEEKEALTLVAAADDAQLGIWAGSEKRVRVMQAIKARVAQLAQNKA